MGMLTFGGTQPISHPAPQDDGRTVLAVRGAGPIGAARTRLLDRVRAAVRARHYSRRTEKDLRRVDPPIHPLPWPTPPSRDGRGRGDSVPDLAGRREARRGLDPEPGAERTALP